MNRLKSMHIGQKLIAKRSSDSPKLTADKQYPVVSVMGEAGMADRFYIIDDEGQYCDFFEGEKDSILQIVPSFGTWYSIESAPKDGTVFIGLEDDEVYKMKWVTGIPPVDSCFRLSDGNIHKIHIWGGEFEYKYPNPTHWTPLPELPKE